MTAADLAREAFPGAPTVARRTAALLMWHEGWSYPDIAAELGWASHSCAHRAAQTAQGWRLDRPAYRLVVAVLAQELIRQSDQTKGGMGRCPTTRR